MIPLIQVYAVSEELGFHSYIGADRLVFPWRDHIVTAYLDERNPNALVFDTDLRTSVGMEYTSQLARVITEWNRERLGPTMSLRVGDDATVSLHARSSLLISRGVTDEQLTSFIKLAMETARIAVDYLAEEFPELSSLDNDLGEAQRKKQDTAALAGPLPRDRHINLNELDDDPSSLRELDRRRAQEDIHQRSDDMAPTEEHSTPMSTDDDFYSPSPDHPSEPTEVSVDRVRTMLFEMGIEKTQGDEDIVIAWINDVLFGFFLDNGPSYLIKGHWDPNLNPETDFLRLFLLCNDWNESSISTKAFCHEDVEGLQVRVEFTVPVREGLSDEQLEHNTAVAINQVLQAIDSISSDATGTSAVAWP
ncbi:YbjN domain-containing protein [Corynebacterium atrinae]